MVPPAMAPTMAPIRAPAGPFRPPLLFPMTAPARAPAAPPSTAPCCVLGPVPTHPLRRAHRASATALFLVSMGSMSIKTYESVFCFVARVAPCHVAPAIVSNFIRMTYDCVYPAACSAADGARGPHRPFQFAPGPGGNPLPRRIAVADRVRDRGAGVGV